MADESLRTVYLSWKSPSRLFKKRDKEFFRNIAAIVFLLFVILFFAKEFPLILAVVSIAFLVYVFSTVPPEDIEHIVSNQGIESAGRLYVWDELKDFSFEEQWGQKMVIIQQQTGTNLILLLADVPPDQIKEIFSRFLRFQENPQKSLVDNAASWLSKKIPLENPS
jgi:hypothetical protein